MAKYNDDGTMLLSSVQKSNQQIREELNEDNDLAQYFNKCDKVIFESFSDGKLFICFSEMANGFFYVGKLLISFNWILRLSSFNVLKIFLIPILEN